MKFAIRCTVLLASKIKKKETFWSYYCRVLGNVRIVAVHC
jgi:hypothetical protein